MFFSFLQKNQQCQIGVDNYKKYLAFDNEEQTGFYSRHLEDFVDVLTELSNCLWAKELKDRYMGDD